MTSAVRTRVSATQAKILADLKRFGAGGPVARVYTETVGLREDIAVAIQHGVPLEAIVQSVATRCEVDRRSAIEGLRQSLDGLGLDLSLPRGHRPKSDSLRGDLRRAESNAPPEPAPAQSVVAKKEAAQHPAPAVKQAPAPAPVSPSVPPSPVPFPDIPRGELTHTERAEIAKKWIEAQFGGRHPTQVKPDELSPEAQVWLEKLWDKSAPVDPKTGQPYAFKRLTGDGRPTYDEPWWPPEAVALENSARGYLPVHDAQARDRIKKYGLTLRADGNNVVVFDKNGKYQVGGIRHDDTACLARSLRDIDYSIQEQIRNGIPY
ncbi:MAG: hypothetical protein KGL42_12545 [Betaproteobacteria bacterium]|jgi:hypothetical protein|nr:hypothetical protein [Betaproteobacteria bacterium]